MVEPVHTFDVRGDTFYLFAPDTPADFFDHYAPFVRLWQAKRLVGSVIRLYDASSSHNRRYHD